LSSPDSEDREPGADTVAVSHRRRGPAHVAEAGLAGVCLLVLAWLLYLHGRIVVHPGSWFTPSRAGISRAPC
jgi:hypothetical protein